MKGSTRDKKDQLKPAVIINNNKLSLCLPGWTQHIGARLRRIMRGGREVLGIISRFLSGTAGWRSVSFK